MKESLDLILNGWDKRRASDDFDSVNLVENETRCFNSLSQRLWTLERAYKDVL